MSRSRDYRQYAPATQRNREPIAEILLQVLPSDATVLEISSGTGEHAIFLAPRLFPGRWIPSDPSPKARASIAAWRDHCPVDNLAPPLAIDVCDPVWVVEQPDHPEVQGLELARNPIMAIVNINMIHIAPWSACLGLMAGAGRILTTGGVLYLYGPFKRGGEHTAASNAMFDQSLQAQNPDWGIRNLEAVVAAAEMEGLTLMDVYAMPANNLSVVFRVC